MTGHILSKSTYMRGLKCHKSLYLNKYGKELRDETSDSQQYIFDQGTEIGELAANLFPHGIDLTPDSVFDYTESIRRTQELISRKERVIYEAAFLQEGVLCAIDILVYDGKNYRAYEVKGSTSVSDTYIQDASLQYYLITKSGVKLMDISIVHINNEYVKKGDLDINQLFTIQSVLTEVLNEQKNIPNNIAEFKKVLEKKNNPPTIDIGAHCNSPYSCDFLGHCWKHIPENSIFDLSGLRSEKKFALYNNGIITFNQITKEAEESFLNDKQKMQVFAELEQRTYLDGENIRSFINELQFPLYFLDFETMMPAIPLYDDSRPFQQIVFQYSLHILKSKGSTPEHDEFLAEPDKGDPRRPFIEKLIKDCGNSGDILVYNIGFEKGRLNELAEDFPEYSVSINKIIARLKDLMIPFFKRWYYTPEMKGSYSIKSVLPALVPDMSYSDLEIQEGGTASATFTEMARGTFKGDVAKTRRALIEYCTLDTLAMVKIYQKLKEI
ncbi:MAG: DUF2779 domain-containing protein [Bacteroidia bacterium]|nr:DUF2779 domain-containing protein [Bacteroidia bacterium]